MKTDHRYHCYLPAGDDRPLQILEICKVPGYHVFCGPKLKNTAPGISAPKIGSLAQLKRVLYANTTLPAPASPEPEDINNDQPGPASEKEKNQMEEASDLSSWDPESDEEEEPSVKQVAQVADSLLALVRSKAAEINEMTVFHKEVSPLVSDEINEIITELNQLAGPAHNANLLAPYW